MMIDFMSRTLSFNFIIVNSSHILVPFTFFYFVQLLPGIGYFITTMYRMSDDVFNFLVVFFIWCVPFAHGFVKCLSHYNICNVIDGSHFTGMLYDTFSVVFNMIDFQQAFDSMNQHGITYLQVYHFVFVIFTTLLLLNLIIAVFSNTVNVMSQYKEQIITLQRLNVTLTVETRMSSMLRLCYRRLQRKWLRHENGRIYVIEAVSLH
jgi:hypothetical protein